MDLQHLHVFREITAGEFLSRTKTGVIDQYADILMFSYETGYFLYIALIR